METFTKLFGSLLLFVYHCFDRVVINGYLSGLSRPGQVVYFFQNVVGEPVIEQGSPVAAHQRVSGMGGGVCPQPRHPHRMGRERVRKEDYVRPALRRMERAGHHGVYFISEEHGAGPDLPLHAAPAFPPRSQLPHPGPPAQPLHPLLLLHPRRSAGADGDARGLVLSLPGHLLSERPQLHREGTEPREGQLPQERQRFPGRRRSRRAAGCRRPPQPGRHPQTARLLDAHAGAEVLQKRTQRR